MSDTHIQVFSPATGEEIGSVPISSPEDVAAAVLRARAAQVEWRERTLKDRCAVIRRVKDVMIERTDEICELLSKEQGKPKFEGLVHEVVNCIDYAHYFTREAPRILAPEPIPLHLMVQRSSYLHWVPRGVIGIIGPWNFPFNLNNGPTIAALIAGNGVIVKPSEYTPLIQDLSRDIFIEGGVPEDLFQVVHGYGATGEAVIDNVDMIEFTGSVATGKKVAARCGERMIPSVLELGGKAPLLVMEDANIERTANAIRWGGYANCGQVCASVERVIVHKSILPSLLERLVPKVKELVPGNTSQDDDIQIGPLNNERQRQIVHSQVQDAVEKGAKIVVGGNPIDGPGYFFEPTILVDVTPEMNIVNAETFGPVVSITALDDEEAMINEANRSHLGLLAYVFCKDSSRGRAIAERIEAGTVMVNDVLSTHGMPETPWGGVKQSGLGHTHGDASLRGMCEQRHVNYDRLPWTKNELYWYPYGPKLYRLLIRGVRFLFSDTIRGRLNLFKK